MKRFVTVAVIDENLGAFKSARHVFVLEDNPETDVREELYKAYRTANALVGTMETEHKELPTKSE